MQYEWNAISVFIANYVYATFPEQGDLDKPKLVIFIDEAHLVFEEASDALLDQIEAIVKLNTDIEVEYIKNGGILHYVLRKMIRS